VHTRRWTLTGVAALTAITFGLTGCGPLDDSGDATTAASSPSPTPASPKDKLAAAAKKAKDQPVTVTIKETGGGINGEAAVNPKEKAGQLVIKAPIDSSHTLTMTFLSIADQSWVKIAGVPGVSATKWQHIDLSKITDKDSIPTGEDMNDEPTGGLEMVENAATVEETGEGKFHATVDATKLSSGGIVDEDVVKALGTNASALPFDVTLDGQGQLSTVSFLAPDDKGTQQTYSVTFKDWGTPSPLLTAPAKADTVEASKTVYDMLNN